MYYCCCFISHHLEIGAYIYTNFISLYTCLNDQQQMLTIPAFVNLNNEIILLRNSW